MNEHPATLLRCVVERITYQNPENGYSVLKVKVKGYNDLVTLVGNLLEVPVLRTGEPRFLVIGGIGGKIWTGVITYRGNAVRIISVRRARKDEVEHYGS